MAIIITRQIYQSKGKKTAQELVKANTELTKVKNSRKLADECVIKIAKKLGMKEKDKDYTYQGIYKVFEERLEEK